MYVKMTRVYMISYIYYIDSRVHIYVKGVEGSHVSIHL